MPCRKRIIRTFLCFDVRLDIYAGVVGALCLIVAAVTR